MSKDNTKSKDVSGNASDVLDRLQKLEQLITRTDASNSKRESEPVSIERRIWVSEKLLDPSVIGLTGFSMATVLLGFLKVGYWEEESNTLLAFWGFFVGGAMQIQAGIYEHKCGSPFSAWAFSLFGWNWLATGFSLFFSALGLLPAAGQKAEAVKSIWMLFFVICLFILSFRISKYQVPMLFFVLMVFVAEVAGFYVDNSRPWEIISGVSAIIAGYMALVLAFAIILKEYWGRTIIPWFPYDYKKENEKSKIKREKGKFTAKRQKTSLKEILNDSKSSRVLDHYTIDVTNNSMSMV